ncbi:hypothetical protein BCF55_1566 [Hydrogenivirga caldilitoris]|uniref:Uncharacterized protein n=1 Tax=Hydrogenivirga caldilitoris TaxID=246264 RepID=A0A497XQK6_9AQUI|nr:hypothetical protein [Hydrogenivirga caldilitoris]RLJ71267.1 hypothetical protein BCF55_1566 [Hydrogenivirga caldilitoris]
MSEVEKPLPDWVRERILQKVQNKALAEEALKYISLVEKEDGTVWVKENFEDTHKHALLFMVLNCVNYAQRLLRGEDIEDD